MENLSTALSSPFGSTALTNIPEPWVVSTVLAAGWLGGLLLFCFLRKLALELDGFNQNYRHVVRARLASLLLLGIMTTFIAFNDYQMNNYSGLILTAFIYRAIGVQNETASLAE